MKNGFYRRYRAVAEPAASWQRISIAEVRRGLSGNYRDVDMAIDAMRVGLTVPTPFAEYRYVHAPEERGEIGIDEVCTAIS